MVLKKGQYELTKKLVRKHIINILGIANRVNWSQSDAVKISQFELIKPWKYDSKTGATLDALRKELLPFLPIYINLSEIVKNEMVSSVERQVEELKKNKKNLNQYPAYEGITLDHLLNYSTEVSYLILGVYFQKIGVTDVNSYIDSVINKGSFMDDSFKIAKLLVRWDVAQLSIYSTEKLYWKFSQQESKSQAFLQETLDWSKTLTPLWNEFHAGRSFVSERFLEANAKYSDNFDEIDVQNFFVAINRNILKTTVYPNMMAFAFYMAKTEWSATIRIWWFTIYLNTSMIMDYMMTGQYRNPWFNFTYLKKTRGFWRMEDKTTLFRSEIYDALYYFFTTNTFQTYKINADDFLSLIGKSLIKKRRVLFEKTLATQKELFLPDNAPSNYLAKWCEGLKTGHF